MAKPFNKVILSRPDLTSAEFNILSVLETSGLIAMVSDDEKVIVARYATNKKSMEKLLKKGAA